VSGTNLGVIGICKSTTSTFTTIKGASTSFMGKKDNIGSNNKFNSSPYVC
jgi:hypothetical protein